MASRSDIHSRAQLAAKFNEFYSQITSPEVIQIGNYLITSDLGEGAFGKVYLATHVLLNVQVVLKCGPKDDPNIVREIYYHSQLRHKHIVKLYEVIKTETNLWLVLEYCEGNELYYHIYNSRRLDYKQCQGLFYQIMQGVAYVHLLNLCHRDLKLENILLADAKKTLIKLTDFGFVREFNPARRSLLSTICGTTVYMAPEMFNNLKYLGYAVDIWSLGIILYTMFYGELPFDEDDEMDNRYKIVYEEPNYREIIPKDAIELIRSMLTKDPKKRATLSDIMASPFLRGLHKKELERANSYTKRDTESILSINQHFALHSLENQLQPQQQQSSSYKINNTNLNKKNQLFETKIEKSLLKTFKNLNIDLDQMKQSIIENRTNSLTAFYELALTREYKRKKQKYYSEKKRRYKEAKKSLRTSRNRVKSALSLSDMGGTQPLERILSGLSISSKTKPASVISDRRSISSIQRDSIPGTTTPSVLVPPPAFTTSKLQQSSSIGSVSMSPLSKVGTSAQSLNTSSHTVGMGKPRSVSFSYPQSRPLDRHSDNPKRKKFIDRLQFWKKQGGSEDIYEINEERLSLRNSRSASASEETRETPKTQDDRPISNRNESKSVEIQPQILYKDESFNSEALVTKNGNLKSNSTDISSTNDAINTNKEPTDASNSNIPSSHRLSLTSGLTSSPINGTTTSSPGVISREGSSYYRNRTRPSSVVSQVSQLSHQSQLSTMISESELDILGETDTMDDFDYYDEDEDRMYESSINNSHNDLRQLSSGMTPSSSYASTNKRGPRLRPSYRRALSSDMSIMSTSTSNTAQIPPSGTKLGKKHKLSHVSSASSISEQSSIRSSDNISAMAPQQLTESHSQDNHSPPIFNRTNSPLQFRNPTIDKSNQLSGNGTSPVPNGLSLFSTFMNGVRNEPFSRSHSPPVPDKFNKLKRKHIPMVDKRVHSPSPISTAVVTSARDTHQVDEKSIIRGPKPVLAAMYEPKFIINEEEEDGEEEED